MTKLPHVAILIPSCGQRPLANLARDAIAKFTTDVSHEVLSLDHAGAHAGVWSTGSAANGWSVQLLTWGALAASQPTHVFAMHDDALPLRAGWLSYLLSKPGPVTGVKASERNGYAHGSGVLFTREFALTHSMQPDLPARDAAEWPAAWCAKSQCWRPSRFALWHLDEHEELEWWHPFPCDLSYDDEGRPFYCHFGGGSLNNRPDKEAWIAAARKALGL